MTCLYHRRRVESSNYCTLSRRGHHLSLTDTSKHGTFMGEEKITKRILGYGATFQIGPYAVSLQETTDSAEETVSVFSPKHHEFIVACDDALVIERSIFAGSIWTSTGGVGFSLTQIENKVGGIGSSLIINDESLDERALLCGCDPRSSDDHSEKWTSIFRRTSIDGNYTNLS